VWVYETGELPYLVLQLHGHKEHTTIFLLTNKEEKEERAYWKLYNRFGHGLVSVEQN
jgi:hypothetical protein